MMTEQFNLGLSDIQKSMQDRLHMIARDSLRELAADAESDGLDLNMLAGHLDSAGIAPVTLLERRQAEPHTLLIAVEELAYGDADIAWAAVPAFQIATVLSTCGSDAQCRTARQVFADNPAATASVMLYEDFGRQPSEFETPIKAVEGSARIEGYKCSVAHPAAGDISLLVGTEADELAAFCFTGVPPGLVAERDDREVGKLAVTAVPSGPVNISGLTLSSDTRLEAGIALHRAVGQARLLLAACLVGLARASVEFCSAYAVQRTTWGKPLAEYQGVAFPLVEHATEVEEVRLLLWDVATQLHHFDEVGDIERSVTRAVNRASSLCLRATRDGVQLIGVRAITRDLPSERWYRQAGVLGAIDFDVLQTPLGLS